MDLGALVRRLVGGPDRAGDTADGTRGTPAPGGPAAGPAARPAWRSLPPIQRVAARMPLVAPNAAFESGLATRQPAPTALAPLGHDRRLEAPAGLVSGVATPVQRRAEDPVPARVRPAHPSPARAATAQRSTAAGAWPGAGPEPAGGSTVSAEAPEAPAAPSPLVTAPALGEAPVGLVGRAATPAASAVGTPPQPADAPGRADSAPVVAGPLIARAADRGAEGAPTGASADPDRAVGDRPVRRIRVGAPLTPTVSRVALPGEAAPATAATPPATGLPPGGPAGPGGARSDPGPTPPAGPGAPVAGAGSPARPAAAPVPGPRAALQRSAVDAPARSGLVGDLRPVLGTMPAISIGRPTAPADAPGAAAEGAATPPSLATLARAEHGAPAWAQPGPSGGAMLPSPAAPPFTSDPGPGFSPARLTWSNPALAEASAAVSGPIGRPAAATPAVAMRAAASPAGPTASRPVGRAGGIRLGAPAGQLAGRAAEPGRTAPAARGDREPGLTAPGADPSPAAPTALWPGPSASSGWAVGDGTAAPTVARSAGDDALAAGGGDTPDVAAAGGGPAPSGVVPAGGQASSPGGGMRDEAARDQETQAWADRLYDRIALRLRRDLLVERERAGTLVDRGF